MKTGVLGGTITVVFANISSSDLLKTIILAAVGALVSSVVSVVVKKIAGRQK